MKAIEFDKYLLRLPRAKNSVLESPARWVCNSNEVMNLKIVQREDDLFAEDGYFHPIFTNQALLEEITGYLNLNIDVYLTATTLRPYININYDAMEPLADDILNKLSLTFKNGYTTKYAKFIKWLDEDLEYSPPGVPVKEFFRKNPDSAQEHYIVFLRLYKVRANDNEFKHIHMNFQSAFMFFIDGLSFIQLDPYWTYYIIYKCAKMPGVKRTTYAVCGYATTYEFWEFHANRCRTRISQFLILPPYQRQGFGKELLDGIYSDLLQNPKCYEITVEDPSYEFENMRDGYDIKLILANGFLKVFKERIHRWSPDGITSENYTEFQLRKPEMEKISKRLKLTKSRVMRCFLLIKFALLDGSDRKALDMFKSEIKSKGRMLIKDFGEKKLKTGKFGSRIVQTPYMCLGSKTKKGLMKVLGL